MKLCSGGFFWASSVFYLQGSAKDARNYFQQLVYFCYFNWSSCNVCGTSFSYDVFIIHSILNPTKRKSYWNIGYFSKKISLTGTRWRLFNFFNVVLHHISKQMRNYPSMLSRLITSTVRQLATPSAGLRRPLPLLPLLWSDSYTISTSWLLAAAGNNSLPVP